MKLLIVAFTLASAIAHANAAAGAAASGEDVQATAALGQPGQSLEDLEQELAEGKVPADRMSSFIVQDSRFLRFRFNTFNNNLRSTNACTSTQVQVAAANACFNTCIGLCATPAGGPFDAATPCL